MRRFILPIALFALALPLLAQKPATSWDDLKAGNRQFITAGNSARALPMDVHNRMPGGQRPAITVLSCADSRVPPELIFDQTIGSLFVVRTAGNVASTLDIASIEYAIKNNWTRVIVVMGHSDCGAVKAALEIGGGGSPSLDALVDRIRESFVGIGPWSPANLRKATEANARSSAAYLLAHSAVIRDAVFRKGNPVVVIPAYYDMTSGEVTRLAN
jgi:carbonic anhydrase